MIRMEIKNIAQTSQLKDNLGRFIKGIHYNPKTEFKLGKPSPRKGIRKPGWTNQSSFKSRENLWRTHRQEYENLHRWIKKEKGQPRYCEICKSTSEKLYHWANKSRKYQKDLSDWFRLCHKCHRKYDYRLVSIKRAGNKILNAHFNKNKILLIGNGGSMDLAIHFAGELMGRFEKDREPIAALSLSNSIILTAISNDSDFKYSFSRQVEALGEKGDLLICFTTSDFDKESGHNINLWTALNKAVNNKKMRVILFGSDKTKRMRNYASCFISGIGNDTPEIQNDHLKLIHLICRYIESKL